MNPSQARFAPAQVANTIKSALPPTWNTGFTGVTAAERAVALSLQYESLPRARPAQPG